MTITPLLVVKTGPLGGQKYSLVPGQVTTIGRSPTNKIALPDEVCSRHHCEIFYSGGRWIIRDLNSRNGTRVQGFLIHGDQPLQPGEVIQLGNTQLWFTVPEQEGSTNTPEGGEHETASDIECAPSAPEIVYSTRESSYRAVTLTAERDRISRDLGRLFRLAVEMNSARSVQELSACVLRELLSSTGADIGAILASSPPGKATQQAEDLKVLAYRSSQVPPHQRVSHTLTQMVLSRGEAVLAHDMLIDPEWSQRDSVLDLKAQSVICVPIRSEERLWGVIHLYCTDPKVVLEPADLDFALAVADQFAIVSEKLHHQQELERGLERIARENEQLREQLHADTELVGESACIRSLREKIARIAPIATTVLIRGESGVGKELVARAIHQQSPRRQGPFVTMNCAALNESLLESDLFGHEKGAFTGAYQRKLGKFEQADGGTLFLDEVGEMSLSIQSKFLRVLEGHPFERVGGGESIRVDVRVVAATNRDLEQAVLQGQFRKDLYFRLHVVELQVAPLRARREDIALLAQHFLQKILRKIGRSLLTFTPEALELLCAYDWPGNVRELQNVVERAVILAPGPTIGPEDLSMSPLGQVRQPMAANMNPHLCSLEELERQHILQVLSATRGNKSQAAQILGIERSTLDRKLKRYEHAQRSEHGGAGLTNHAEGDSLTESV